MLRSAKINKQALIEIQRNIQQNSPTPKKVKLIAVTKTLSFKSIEGAIKNKIIHIGESRLQETKEKIKKQNKTTTTIWHFIGPLQSNKIKAIVQIFDIIQTVDSFKKANKINKEAKKINKIQEIMIQININNNPKQQGVKIEETEQIYTIITQMSNINIVGLMAIGPNTKQEQKIKEKFQEVIKLKKKIEKKNTPKILEISLGMSSDYRVALKEGATYIRIGRKLFQ